MITERELRLMNGWCRLTKLERKIVEYIISTGEDGVSGSLSSLGRKLGFDQSSNVVKSVNRLAGYGIISKELRSAYCCVLTMTEDCDNAVMRLGDSVVETEEEEEK